MDLSIVDFLAHWIALTTSFLLLTALFRKQIKLEGTSGYFLCLCLLIPLNIVISNTNSLIPPTITEPQVAIAGLIVVSNLLLFYLLTDILPALCISSKGAMVLFAIVFSTASVVVSFIPEMPDIFRSNAIW